MQNGIEAKLTPENQNDYNKFVVAGLRIALNGGAQSFMGSNSLPKTLNNLARNGS